MKACTDAQFPEGELLRMQEDSVDRDVSCCLLHCGYTEAVEEFLYVCGNGEVRILK